MILRSIEVSGWRCFADSVRVGPFGDGITVLFGPNGTGKSTLFDAMARALLDRHRVSGADADTLRPWGRNLAPTVAVEFMHEGVEYRLEKKFLDHPSALLRRREAGRFVRLDEDDAADERVRGFLKGEAPGKGVAQVRHWGLAQVLWAPQGALDLPELSGDLPNDIRAMLGAQVAGPAGSRIEQKIQELYRGYYTATGKVKSGKDAPEAVRLEQELEKARGTLQEVRVRLAQYEAMSRKLEDLRNARAQARRDADAISETLANAARRVQQYAALRAERKEKAAQAKAADAQHSQIKQRIEDIRKSAADLAEAEKQRAEIAADLAAWERTVEEAGQQRLQSKARLENARAGQAATDAARREAELARRYVESAGLAREAGSRLESIRGAEAELEARRTERTALRAPDPATLAAVRQAVKDRDEAQVGLDAALTWLEIVPARDCELRVVAGETPGPQVVRAGSAGRFTGSPEVVVEVEGFGRIRAGGPSASAEEYRAVRDEAASRLARLAAPFGTQDMVRLEALRDEAQRLDGLIAEAATRLETMLAGRSRQALEQQLAAHQTVVAGVEQERPLWAQAPPDVAALDQHAEAVRVSVGDVVARAELELAAAERAHAAAQSQCAGLGGRLQEIDRHVASSRERWQSLAADGKSDEQRQAERNQRELDWGAARAALAQIDEKLEAFPEDPSEEHARLQRQREAANQAAQEALAEEARMEGQLADRAAEGPYSAAAAAEENEAALAAQHARERLRMDAIGLLRETYWQAKEQAIAGIVAPVEAAATRIIERIAGRRLGPIRLTSGFVPDEVRPQVAGAGVSLKQASGGEREQIFLAARLALAEVIARRERQLVVLDDTLTATDAGRLARVMRVLEEAAQKLQILILTCHPERYRALEGAHFINLEEAVAS